MTLTLVYGGTAAIAQSQSAGSSGEATIPQAPIGHRQPRADQVPSGKTFANPNDALHKGKRHSRPEDEEPLPGMLMARLASTRRISE